MIWYKESKVMHSCVYASVNFLPSILTFTSSYPSKNEGSPPPIQWLKKTGICTFWVYKYVYFIVKDH